MNRYQFDALYRKKHFVHQDTQSLNSTFATYNNYFSYSIRDCHFYPRISGYLFIKYCLHGNRHCTLFTMHSSLVNDQAGACSK